MQHLHYVFHWCICIILYVSGTQNKNTYTDYIYAGHTPTGGPGKRTGPSISILQDQLTRCSLAMGLNERSLDSSTVNSVATNISLFLSALQYTMPQNFSRSYRSPCWFSQLTIPYQWEGLGTVVKERTNRQSLQLLRSRFYNHVFISTRNRTRDTLLCLPAFFLAGFPKCGTTTLHTMLSEHPMIAQPYRKEPHWWTRIPLNNMNQKHLRLAVIFYLQYFKIAPSSHGLLTYDASQSTLWDSNFLVNDSDYCAMPAAVSHILPHAKFVVVMRDPVERTFSNFLYGCTMYYTPNIANWPHHHISNVTKAFHNEVVKSVADFNRCLLNNRSVFECASDKQLLHREVRTCEGLGLRIVVSIYYIHILKWLQFFPKDQFLFLRLEDLSSNPQAFMDKITDFLNIDHWTPSEPSLVENKGKIRLQMLPETRELLSDFYRPFNQQLVNLTGDSRFLW